MFITDKLVTVIIGERSNLSYGLAKKINNCVVFSSSSLLQSLEPLSSLKNNEINLIFNNFQPSNQFNVLTNPSTYIQLSISLTVEVLEYLIENEIKINKIIYSSSCSVYGNSINADENGRLCPTGIAPSLKYLNEQFLTKICFNNGVDLIITRIFNMFGENDNFSVIKKIIDCYQNKIPLNVINNGKSIRDFIHINNVVDVYEKLLEEPGLKFEIIDIGSGQGRSVADILNYLTINGYFVKTLNTDNMEIDFSQADVRKIQKFVDVTSFIDVNLFLLDEFRRLDG
jgi:nucleoside-diphosphate-sugar epimerase